MAQNPPPSARATQPGHLPTVTGAIGATGVTSASPRCGTAMLSARFLIQGPAAGHRYAALVLTNSANLACRTSGYPGMQLVAASGAPIPTKLVRMVHTEPLRITLYPGESAWTLLRWSVVPAPGEPQHGPCEPTPKNAWVTPPDERSHLTGPWVLGFVCEHGTIQLSPLAPGDGPAG